MTTYIVCIKYHELKSTYVSEAHILTNAERGEDAMYDARQLFYRYRSQFITHHEVISTRYKEVELPCIIKT